MSDVMLRIGVFKGLDTGRGLSPPPEIYEFFRSSSSPFGLISRILRPLSDFAISYPFFLFFYFFAFYY